LSILSAIATTRRVVIVNADDFGRTRAVNRGIQEAHERGIVTSASLMVRQPGADEAAAYAKQHPDLAVGLHLDLGEWVNAGGEWQAVYERALDVPEETRAEIRAQLERFRALLGRDPTHLDSHQHVHRDQPLCSIAVELATHLGIPLRSFDPRIRYRGDFYGQGPHGEPLPEAISVLSLVVILRSLEPGVTELGCHPGHPEDLDSPYLEQRTTEIETLCDPRVRRVLDEEGIELRAFGSPL
jgi:chitin disaccharide deacetylase